jgi:hypothetical protein
MTEYTVVYDYFSSANESFANHSIWLIPIGVIVTLYLIYSKSKHRKFAIVFMSIWTIMAISFTYVFWSNEKYVRDENKRLLNEGKIEVIEDTITNYISNGGIKGSTTSFSVGEAYFYYNQYVIIEGYHQICEDGGIICSDGQKVRIHYLEKFNFDWQKGDAVKNLFRNYIVKIELTQ